MGFSDGLDCGFLYGRGCDMLSGSGRGLGLMGGQFFKFKHWESSPLKEIPRKSKCGWDLYIWTGLLGMNEPKVTTNLFQPLIGNEKIGKTETNYPTECTFNIYLNTWGSHRTF